MESTQNPSGNDLVLQRVETRKAQMKRLVCVTERLIHFCVRVYLHQSLETLQKGILVYRSFIRLLRLRLLESRLTGLRVKVLFSLVEKVLKIKFYS